MRFTDWSGTPRLLNYLNSVRAVAASRDPESTWWYRLTIALLAGFVAGLVMAGVR